MLQDWSLHIIPDGDSKPKDTPSTGIDDAPVRICGAAKGVNGHSLVLFTWDRQAVNMQTALLQGYFI